MHSTLLGSREERGASCEPDEARGSQLCPAYSLHVARRWRPSNVAVAYRSRESEASGEMARKTWRHKLAQYPSVEFGPRMGYTRRQGVARSAGPSPARRTI